MSSILDEFYRQQDDNPRYRQIPQQPAQPVTPKEKLTSMYAEEPVQSTSTPIYLDLNSIANKGTQASQQDLQASQQPTQPTQPTQQQQVSTKTPKGKKGATFVSTTEKAPTYTRKEAKVSTTIKQPETEYTEKIMNPNVESREEYDRRTGADKILGLLEMRRPLPPKNAERNKRVMGYQAIGEALRNVVDAVQGTRKAKIGKHKSYVNEFAKKIEKDDAIFANSLKDYYKTLDDTKKLAMDDYLKYVDQSYTKKTTREGGNSQTTTEGGDSYTEGGGQTTSNFGYSSRPPVIKPDKPKAKPKLYVRGSDVEDNVEMTWVNKGTKIATPAQVRATAQKIANEPLQMKNVDPELIKKVRAGTATYDELIDINQQYVTEFPDKSWTMADSMNVETYEYVPTDVDKIAEEKGQTTEEKAKTMGYKGKVKPSTVSKVKAGVKSNQKGMSNAEYEKMQKQNASKYKGTKKSNYVLPEGAYIEQQ